MTADDTLEREIAELEAALAAPMRDARPEPRLAFTADLDRRVAARFPRRRRRLPSLAVPGLALSGAAAAVIAVVALTGGGGGRGSTPAMDSAGGGSSVSGATAQQDKAAPSIAAPAPPAGGSPSSDSRTKRFVERSASLTLTAPTDDLSEAADRIVAVADRVGGFVASSSVSSTTGGDFVLRVPTGRLQDALAQLSRIGHVRERRQDAVDITAEHTSATSRLAEARVERTSLLRRLARATTDAQAASLRARLRDVDRRIALDRAALKRVDNRAQYANVAVTLAADDHSAGAPGGGGWSPGDAAQDALRILEVAAGVLLVAAAVSLPLALVVLLIVVALRLSARRGRERALDVL